MQKIKTQWDLSQFYRGVNDPKIEQDVKKADRLVSAFEKKYKNNDSFYKKEEALAKALKEFEQISEVGLYRPYMFLYYSKDLNSLDKKVEAKMNLISQEFTKIGNKLIFFEVKLSKIDRKTQEKFLKSKKLEHYKYFLKKIFDSSKFILSEPEEKILSLKYLPSHGLWTDLTEKLLTKATVKHKGENIPLSKANNLIGDLPSQQERVELHNKIMNVAQSIADVAEAELNAIVTDKKINDELRGYKEPIDATILSYQNDRKSVENLVKTVTQNFHVSNYFYKVKAKMLKLKTLSYADRAAIVGKKEMKVNFEESFKTLQKVFENVDPEFRKILDRMAENGQIDAYPKVGKRGGAYCSHEINTPTMVMLNHTDSFNSHMTFAHEMGHAIHSELSKVQPVMYQSYSMSTAEVASTLFENFAFADALSQMSDKEKIVALHDKIQDDIATIFRQIACLNFEIEMHKSIREKGNVSKEELSEKMNKHLKAYLGPAFKLEEADGYNFVTWPHLRYTFYVYSYAFGQLASKAIYKKYSEDKNYVEKIKKFLSLGGSMSPEDIFKSIGIDVKKPDFWKEGIKSIEEDIKLLDKLVSRK